MKISRIPPGIGAYFGHTGSRLFNVMNMEVRA